MKYISQKAARRRKRGPSSHTDETVEVSSHNQLMLYYFNFGIEWQWSQSHGGLSWQLQSYPVLEPDHSLFQVCKSGTVEALQHYLSETPISPFSIDPDGFTLLDFTYMVGCSS
jgi:hypothetical protein